MEQQVWHLETTVNVLRRHCAFPALCQVPVASGIPQALLFPFPVFSVISLRETGARKTHNQLPFYQGRSVGTWEHAEMPKFIDPN